MLNFKTCVEIPIFFIIFCICLQGPVFTNLVIYRTCYVDLGYKESECILLGSENKNNYTQKLENLVEPYANIILMVLSLPVGIICAISALFIGSWSDRFGRKQIIIVTTAGQCINVAIITLFSLLTNISSWYLAFSSIPVLFSGGFAAALTVFLSYLTDITDENNRGVRMGVFEIVISVGMLLGMVSSSYIFNAIGYVGIYAISTVIHIIALVYIVFILEESLPNTETEGKLKAFFELEQIKVMARTTFKKRENNKHILILLCLIIASLFIFAVMSEGGCTYLFLRLKFGWSLKQYTLFTSTRDLISIFGTFIAVYGLHKYLKVDESILILIGLISCMNASLVQGLASTNFHIYFGGSVRLFAGIVSPMLRSLLSKITEQNEVGKIFSVVVMFENFLQLIGSPIYTYIYNNTLDIHPEFFNFITAGVYGFIIILAIIVVILFNKLPVDTLFNVLNEDEFVEEEGENQIIH